MTEGTSPDTGAKAPHGADSEVGRLRTVMLHRPGPELKRLTPRNNDKLLFDCLLYTSPSPRDGLLSRMPSSA